MHDDPSAVQTVWELVWDRLRERERRAVDGTRGAWGQRLLYAERHDPRLPSFDRYAERREDRASEALVPANETTVGIGNGFETHRDLGVRHRHHGAARQEDADGA